MYVYSTCKSFQILILSPNIQKDDVDKPSPSKIPVLNPRQKRRAKSATNDHEPAVKQKALKGTGSKSNIKIKNYRADYTWNRGGRLKEIRIRYHITLKLRYY